MASDPSPEAPTDDRVTDECADAHHDNCWHLWCQCGCHDYDDTLAWQPPVARPIERLNTGDYT